METEQITQNELDALLEEEPPKHRFEDGLPKSLYTDTLSQAEAEKLESFLLRNLVDITQGITLGRMNVSQLRLLYLDRQQLFDYMKHQAYDVILRQEFYGQESTKNSEVMMLIQSTHLPSFVEYLVGKSLENKDSLQPEDLDQLLNFFQTYTESIFDTLETAGVLFQTYFANSNMQNEHITLEDFKEDFCLSVHLKYQAGVNSLDAILVFPGSILPFLKKVIIDQQVIQSQSKESRGMEYRDISLDTLPQSQESHRIEETYMSENKNKVKPLNFSYIVSPNEEDMKERRLNTINQFMDINMSLRVELGRTTMKVRDILALGEGSIVELQKLAGEPVDVFVNDQLMASAEVVVIDEYFGIRITAILDTEHIENQLEQQGSSPRKSR